MKKVPRMSPLQLAPRGGVKRLATPLVYGGGSAVYAMAPNYGKPKSLGKINTPIKK